MVTGVNHVTFSVSDLERSFRFYVDVLGLQPVARWYKGAYLLAGNHWICLNVDPATRSAALPEYTHLAFAVEPSDFDAFEQRLGDSGAIRWQENHSPGRSVYFLDPDGHKLEIHCSNLSLRLEELRRKPPRDLMIYTQANDEP